MTDKLSKAQRDEAEAICKRLNVHTTAIDDVIDMYSAEANDYEPNNFEKWTEGQREGRSYLFIKAAALDLETLAFEQRNVSARGKLYQELGPALFAERCKAWGLSGPNDFSQGTQPDSGASSNSKPNKKPDSSNPFSRAGWNITAQGRILKTNKQLAENLAKAAGVTIGATRPNL
jgi:hypothetical protein